MSDELVEARSSNLSAELRNPAYNDESDGHVRLRAADEIDRLTERLAGAYASVNLLTEMLEAKAPPEATGGTATVRTGAKIAELVNKYPGLGIDTFVHERASMR